MKSLKTLLSLILLMLSLVQVKAGDTIYYHSIVVDSVYNPGFNPEFSFYLPQDVDSIRGVYYYIDGVWGSSVPMAEDSAYQALANKHHFIIMGCKMHPRMALEAHIWSGPASVAALDSLSILVNKPFIGDLPFFLEGYSLGGQFAWHFARTYPQRTIAYITMKGGRHRTDPTNSAIRSIPSLWFKGEFDANYRKDNMDFIFRQERENGSARMALLEHQGMAHDPVLDTALINQFFRSCIRLRLSPNSNVLQPLDLKDGFVMHNNLLSIASDTCAPFASDKHSWFPDSLVALEAQRFASLGYTTVHHRCTNTIGFETEHKSPEFSFFPNPFKDQLQLSFNGSFVYEIRDLQGKLKRKGVCETGDITLNLQSLSSGTYLLIARSEQVHVQESLLKI